MPRAKRQKKANISSLKTELKGVEKLFSDIKRDKSLPSFGEHVMLCIALGTSESVNLKKMYPKVHKTFSGWLYAHSAKVLCERKGAK